MANITINNYGTINFYSQDEAIEKAKDKLINRMYYARLSENVIGGRNGWKHLCELYDDKKYEEMKEFISQCTGNCGTRRKEMLECLDIIIKGGEKQ
jgi:hypothetical protein